MTFRHRLQYLLVTKLKVSNKEALQLILSGKILVNGIAVQTNDLLDKTDEVIYQKQVLQEAKKLVYLAFNKPRGIETTLNENIEHNLKEILPIEGIFPVGRLDKESEGLLFLTNDGSLYDRILRNEHKIEKEYIVKVNKPITDEFLNQMSNGIMIMGKQTLPCQLTKIDDFIFEIVLIQGLNRQIRRMCYKLNYEVMSLIRVRIGNLKIGNLKAGEYRAISKNEIFEEML